MQIRSLLFKSCGQTDKQTRPKTHPSLAGATTNHFHAYMYLLIWATVLENADLFMLWQIDQMKALN